MFKKKIRLFSVDDREQRKELCLGFDLGNGRRALEAWSLRSENLTLLSAPRPSCKSNALDSWSEHIYPKPCLQPSMAPSGP